MRPGCQVWPCRYYWIRVHYPGCAPDLTVGSPYYDEHGEVVWWDVTGAPGRVLDLSWVEPIEEIREPTGT